MRISIKKNDKFDELKNFFAQQEANILDCEANSLRRFKCVVAYDGTDFCGWQAQPDGGSVQDFIEEKLHSILDAKIRIHGSGRTDAGVHAHGQVFHFDANWKHSADSMLKALRSGGAQSIRFLSIEDVDDNFHARFSAKGKRYVYRICRDFAMPEFTRYRWSLGGKNIDIEKMRESCEVFIGTHDFKAFSANRGNGTKENTVKTITRLDIEEIGDELIITTEGSGYLYKMVRLIVGALIQVGRGNLTKSDLLKARKNAERTNLFQAAPAQGLFLSCVFY